MNRPVLIVALGDSLTEGFGVVPGQAYPEQLQAELAKAGLNCRMVNTGISGDTCRGCSAGWPAPSAYRSSHRSPIRFGAIRAASGPTVSIPRRPDMRPL
jgi:lysophospholipase L1-like esterase